MKTGASMVGAAEEPGPEKISSKASVAKGGEEQLVWCGPYNVGPVELALYGPTQVVFLILAFLAFVLILITLAQKDKDVMSILTAIAFFLACLYVAWMVKSLYVMQWLEGEIKKFEAMNTDMEAKVKDLNVQAEALVVENQKYQEENAEHMRLNEQELRLHADLEEGVGDLTQQMEDLTQQNETYAEQNVEQQRVNEELATQVGEYKILERRLALLASDCGDNVEQARFVIERLERNLRLGTLNTIFMFFERSDTNSDGQISEDEVDDFVDYLTNLWRHLPFWDPEMVRRAIISQGGLSRAQLRLLVEAMMMEEDVRNALEFERRLRDCFGDGSGDGKGRKEDPGEP